MEYWYAVAGTATVLMRIKASAMTLNDFRLMFFSIFKSVSLHLSRVPAVFYRYGYPGRRQYQKEGCFCLLLNKKIFPAVLFQNLKNVRFFPNDAETNPKTFLMGFEVTVGFF